MLANMMGMRLALVAATIISVSGIKVPIETTVENNTQTKTADDSQSSEIPIYYGSDAEIDSYLVPPNSHQTEEDLSDEIATLATYLLPPSVDKQPDYYKPTEAGEQTDWYPISPAVTSLSRQLLPPKLDEQNPRSIEVNQSEPIYKIYGNLRTGKLFDVSSKLAPVPSRDLQPPSENAPNDYNIASISQEAANQPINRPLRTRNYSSSAWNGPIISIPNNVRENTLPKISYINKKNPTKLYPKKYPGGFKPIPIPLGHFKEEPIVEAQNATPLKHQKEILNIDNQYAPHEDKAIYAFEEAQKKRKEKLRNTKQVEGPETSESNEDTSSREQDTSASNYRVPSRHTYVAPIRQVVKPAPAHQAQSHAPPADGERTEFRMHGMKGPHSYQFGFDTGKGKNRQFRYEERDNDGRVKGHYGYMDKNGKLRVVNYDADPEHGFRAEPPVETE